MAIFRAGKRIGNMDIRIGLPRDRSLDNVEGDKRITEQRPGLNQRTSIGRFMSEINRGEGIARGNRFLVRVFPPRDVVNQQVGERARDVVTVEKDSLLNNDEMRRNIELMCTSVVLPYRNVLSTNFVTYGPGRKMPYGYNYGAAVQCMFMGDKFLRQRAFFETWQGKMHSLESHHLSYYDSYVGTVEIYQLGQYRETDKEHADDNYRVTYGVRLHEVYPDQIGEIQYQALTDDPMPLDIPVTLAFRTWENITLDSINGVDFGKFIPDMPNIKPAKNYGIFGGILSKMPPEIKRAGKQVIEKIRRDIPIGKRTGGRVYPPFVINK